MEKQIGRGAFGVVFRGQYGDLPVAIKQLNQFDTLDKATRSARMREFRLEIELVANLPPHPNIVQTYGYVRHPRSVVLEFASHGSLLDWVRRRTLDARRLHRILTGVAAGMAHLAAHNIVHRDLAARNVLAHSLNLPAS